MSGAPSARRVAFDTLRAVHDADAYANLVLPTAIARARLSPADAALATELTYGTLRQQGTWDAVIAVAANRPAESVDPPVLDILRLGVHQFLATRVPPHATGTFDSSGGWSNPRTLACAAWWKFIKRL